MQHEGTFIRSEPREQNGSEGRQSSGKSAHLRAEAALFRHQQYGSMRAIAGAEVENQPLARIKRSEKLLHGAALSLPAGMTGISGHDKPPPRRQQFGRTTKRIEGRPLMRYQAMIAAGKISEIGYDRHRVNLVQLRQRRVAGSNQKHSLFGRTDRLSRLQAMHRGTDFRQAPGGIMQSPGLDIKSQNRPFRPHPTPEKKGIVTVAGGQVDSESPRFQNRLQHQVRPTRHVGELQRNGLPVSGHRTTSRAMAIVFRVLHVNILHRQIDHS